MADFVQLYWKRNRGWPWPEDSWGLTPMFGEDGWCRSCGVPKSPQSGSLVLQRRGMEVEGAWVPNWRFDVICVEQRVAVQAAARFNIETRTVDWRPASPGDASPRRSSSPHLVSHGSTRQSLREAAIARHGVDGAGDHDGHPRGGSGAADEP